MEDIKVGNSQAIFGCYPITCHLKFSNFWWKGRTSEMENDPYCLLYCMRIIHNIPLYHTEYKKLKILLQYSVQQYNILSIPPGYYKDSLWGMGPHSDFHFSLCWPIGIRAYICKPYKCIYMRLYMHGTLPYAYAAVRFLHARTLVLTLAYVQIYIRNCILHIAYKLLNFFAYWPTQNNSNLSVDRCAQSCNRCLGS